MNFLTSQKKETPPIHVEPVDEMIDMMRRAGVKAYQDPGLWEQCLCALVLALDPKCRTYKFLESLPCDKESYSQTDIANTLAHLGYFSRAVQTSLKRIDKRLLPALFIAPDANPLILLAEEEGRLKIYKNGDILYLEPSRLPDDEGTACLFERFDENRPAYSKFIRTGTKHSWFRALFGRFRATFVQILATGLVLNLIALITPLFIMLIYDRVIATGSLGVLPMILAGMILAVLCEFFLRSVRSHGLSWIAARLDNIVGNQIFAHLVGLPPRLIERASVSAQIARVRTFESIRDFFCGNVFLSLIETPFIVLALLAIYLIAGPLVLVPLGFCAVYAILFYGLYRKVVTAIRRAAKGSSAKQQFTIETFEKIAGIRAYGLNSVWFSKFRDLSGKETMAHFRLSWLGMLGETIAHSLTLLAAVATIGYGAHLIWQGQIGTGALVASMILVWRVLTPFYSICTVIPRLEQIRNSILQVNDLMDLETEAQTARAASRLPRLKGRVTFNTVSLRYAEDSDPVFSDLSFESLPGDLTVITGENGAGKSSVLKLVKGLYQPLSGSIQIDGFDIRQLDAPDLRRQIAYLPQQGDFFHGTILDNLRLSNPLADMEELRQAVRMADAEDDILSLPDRYNTVIDRYSAASLPANLSLRLSLARLYLHTAKILLVDEIPNTVLSGRAGENLREFLASIKGQRTCIMVSYRDDILRMADTLILMRNGKAPLCGQSERLMKTMMEAA